MALGDWTFFKTGTPVINLLTEPPPPVGERWLHLQVGSLGTLVINAVPKDPPYAYMGVTRGRLRTLIRFDTPGTRSNFGFLFMCNQDNMQPYDAAGGAGYGLVLDNMSGVRTVKLVRYTQGVFDLIAGGPILAVSPAGIWPTDVTFAFEASWYLEMPTLSGIVISARLGTAVDFSDLAPVPNLTDLLITTNVFTHANSLGFYTGGWSSLGGQVYLDQTSLETL